MGRLFLVLVLLAVSLYAVKLVRDKLEKPPGKLEGGSGRNNKDKNKANQKSHEKMVRCLHCGLHIPEKEAIKKGDKNFCSIEHAQHHL